MGTLTYASGDIMFTINDRVLAHLQVVIVDKLRRQEGLVLSWNDSRENGSGRMSIWLSPDVPLAFSYGTPFPALNRHWLRLLADAANSAAGLFPVPEPKETVTKTT